MGDDTVRRKLIEKLEILKSKFEKSLFFKTHEIIGSSLLIVYDTKRIGVWMIDFAKTLPVPDNILLDHKSNWVLGNHEDGFLFGLQNLIEILKECKP